MVKLLLSSSMSTTTTTTTATATTTMESISKVDSIYQEVLDLVPDHLESLLSYGKFLFEYRHNHVKARHTLEGALEIDQTNDEVLQLLSRIQQEEREEQQQLVTLRKQQHQQQLQLQASIPRHGPLLGKKEKALTARESSAYMDALLERNLAAGTATGEIEYFNQFSLADDGGNFQNEVKGQQEGEGELLSKEEINQHSRKKELKLKHRNTKRKEEKRQRRRRRKKRKEKKYRTRKRSSKRHDISSSCDDDSVNSESTPFSESPSSSSSSPLPPSSKEGKTKARLDPNGERWPLQPADPMDRRIDEDMGEISPHHGLASSSTDDSDSRNSTSKHKRKRRRHTRINKKRYRDGDERKNRFTADNNKQSRNRSGDEGRRDGNDTSSHKN
jgi:hypothetical protein